jgi:hypothetical protein
MGGRFTTKNAVHLLLVRTAFFCEGLLLKCVG